MKKQDLGIKHLAWHHCT